MTTVGFGEITPANVMERGLMLIVETCGILFFAFIFGAISQQLSKEREGRVDMEKRREMVEKAFRWARKKHLPRSLGSAVVTFYSEVRRLLELRGSRSTPRCVACWSFVTFYPEVCCFLKVGM